MGFKFNNELPGDGGHPPADGKKIVLTAGIAVILAVVLGIAAGKAQAKIRKDENNMVKTTSQAAIAESGEEAVRNFSMTESEALSASSVSSANSVSTASQTIIAASNTENPETTAPGETESPKMVITFQNMSGLQAFLSHGDLMSMEEDFNAYLTDEISTNITTVTWLPDQTENIDEHTIRWMFELSDGSQITVDYQMTAGILKFGEDGKEYQVTPVNEEESFRSMSEDVPTSQEIEERQEGGF